jgi:hypothetical protein
MKGKSNMKIGDSVRALIYTDHGAVEIDGVIFALENDEDALVGIEHTVNGEKLWGWVPRLAIQA